MTPRDNDEKGVGGPLPETQEIVLMGKDMCLSVCQMTHKKKWNEKP